MIEKKIFNKSMLLGMILFIFSPNLYACFDKITNLQGMSIKPIGRQSILNGSSIDMYEFLSRNCNLECYIKFLDKNDIEFTIQGILFYIRKNGGFTLQLFENDNDSFSGRVICKAVKKYNVLNMPSYYKLSKPSNDFQTTDSGSVSRTLSYNGISKSSYNNLVNVIKFNSRSFDITNAFSFFEMKDGSEFNLIYDLKRNTGNLVVVYVEKNQ